MLSRRIDMVPGAYLAYLSSDDGNCYTTRPIPRPLISELPSPSIPSLTVFLVFLQAALYLPACRVYSILTKHTYRSFKALRRLDTWG